MTTVNAIDVIDGDLNQKEINAKYLHLTNYKNLVVGNDWSNAIIAAEADAYDKGMALNIPSGNYGYSKNITFRVHVFGQGIENTVLLKLAPATITLLKCGIRDISIRPNVVIEGDTTDGLVADGLDRKYIENVYVGLHGGNGFVYKRGNLSRFFLRSRENKKNGIFFAIDPISGDNKCVEFWFEATANGLNGFIIEDSTIYRDVSSQNHGYLIAQNNGTLGIANSNFDAVFTGIGNDITAYTEYGGGVWHQTGLKASRIFYQNMSHPNFKNDADNTNIVSYIPSAIGSRITLSEFFGEISIGSATKVGQLVLNQTADREFTFSATGSSANQILNIASNLKLQQNGGAYTLAHTSGATLNFSLIPAFSSVERTVNLVPAASDSKTIINTAPSVALPMGLVWNAYVNPADLTKAIIRVSNITNTSINFSGDYTWSVKVFY